MTEEPHVSRPMIENDPEDGSIVVFDGPRRATFKDGKWHSGILFSSAYMMEYFRQVRNPKEMERIMLEAEDVLNEHAILKAKRDDSRDL